MLHGETKADQAQIRLNTWLTGLTGARPNRS